MNLDSFGLGTVRNREVSVRPDRFDCISQLNNTVDSLLSKNVC